MQIGSTIDTLTSIDFQEIVNRFQEIGGKVITIYEGVIYRENVMISDFRKGIDKTLASRQKYRDEHNDLMQGLNKLIMNSFFAAQNRKDINESSCCKSEHWMQTEYDENVLDYWRLLNGN